MSKIKVVTICGSMRFESEQRSIAAKLEVENGWCVIQCIYSDELRKCRGYSLKEIDNLARLHRAKIDISDAIFVVNVGGYMGESTKNEIEYAKENGKEVFYLE